MNTLLLIAHGSRIEDSNQAVHSLAQKLRDRVGAEWDEVGCAFLELGKPSIPEAIDQAVAKGAQALTVVPYFLAPGKHVSKHIPEIIAASQAQYPQVVIQLTALVGAANGMVDLLQQVARDERATSAN